MPCFSPCDYKKEVSLLKKELAALDPVRVKEKLAEAERCILRVTGERDRARTRNKELQKHIESLKYTNQSLNDRLEWTKEDLQKEVKEGKDAQKALKRKKRPAGKGTVYCGLETGETEERFRQGP